MQSLSAQYDFSGKVDTTTWKGNVFLSVIDDYRKNTGVYPVQIISKDLPDSLGNFNLSGNFHSEIIILSSIGTLIGGQIGARISQRINDALLKQSFIYLMTLIGIHLIFQAI